MDTPRNRPFSVLVGGTDIQNCHRSALIQPVSQGIHADRHAAHRLTIRLAEPPSIPLSKSRRKNRGLQHLQSLKASLDNRL